MMKNRVQKAINFAVWKHRNQLRKGTNLPYIIHPLAVMQTLVSIGASEDAIIGGVLHDTLEDTKTSYREIKRKFGEHVADIVKRCSENKSLSWKARKQETIDKMMNPVDNDTFLVEMSDKYCNMCDIFTDFDKKGFWDRFSVGKKSLAWYYDGLGKAIKKYSAKNKGFKVFALSFSTMYEHVFKKG